ncbi:pyridoxal phosphate-dependent aminotransferase [Sporomusa sp.]|uniref:pyridoxal phosphate-dependent aminotransferase n=1 Tax=Sporomusa sp. TaxID=2078658 RepID=UPI002C926AAA|nr:aminotransferase class I/II-fold pyridoxal phosphate-dependent enzyme [Sporomusa sp.]HWR08827.1 aminotransferase class I/II-fold pyridoxal phosphate-dependent enzyme [Sporomusa sp.]
MENIIRNIREGGYASAKARQFTESVIREMSRIAAAHNAINLAQGFPDFPAPEAIKQAAVKAVNEDHNQYAITWGTKGLRDAIAAKVERDYGVVIDPERQLTVCCGATEGMIATLLATVNPGDEVIIFEPFYENYGADVILCGAVPKYVSLTPPEFNFNREELIAAFSDKTRAIIINTPNNPTGKVFNREELELIAQLCIKHDVLAINDEIYEHILYDNTEHIPLWTLPDMADRTIAVNSVSKTFSVTGWRIGYVQASPEITASVRKVHDFLTVGAAAPLQVASAAAFTFGPEYYAGLAGFYSERRDYLLNALEKVGFTCVRPQGAYYIMADITPFGWDDDVAFAKYLASEIGVAVVPGSSFFRPESTAGKTLIRFCFCKKFETLQAAADRLAKLTIRK